MDDLAYETVYTITDWYDGARAGIADFRGNPHYYQCEQDYGPTEDYRLTPLDDETFRFGMEDWAIWLRWEAAFEKGQTTLDAHPALPEDRARHVEITSLLVERLANNSAIKVKAEFLYGKKSLVKWGK